MQYMLAFTETADDFAARTDPGRAALYGGDACGPAEVALLNALKPARVSGYHPH